MGINRESNAYTIIFAIVMVVVVGGGLAALSLGLKDRQQSNILNEKKQNIIQATGFFENKTDVDRKNAGGYFSEYVTKRIVLNFDGEVIDEREGSEEIDLKDLTDAFNVDIRKQYMNISEKTERDYPLFVCEKDGQTVYVIMASGKGLWDDVWGYVGFDLENNKILGAKFDHKGETAGLGSVINEDKFQDQFIGKTFIDGESYKPLRVVKPGSEDLTVYKVDGLSGATFTAKGVEEMMKRNFEVYHKYFKTIQKP